MAFFFDLDWLVNRIEPDVSFVDIRLNQENGIEFAKIVHQKKSQQAMAHWDHFNRFFYKTIKDSRFSSTSQTTDLVPTIREEC